MERSISNIEKFVLNKLGVVLFEKVIYLSVGNVIRDKWLLIAKNVFSSQKIR